MPEDWRARRDLDLNSHLHLHGCAHGDHGVAIIKTKNNFASRKGAYITKISQAHTSKKRKTNSNSVINIVGYCSLKRV